ncbi:heavy-metal-associated domain-containing protein [Bordetella sp. 15P40C-2]|uniref:heavy-metal-associated domain-containing protein n=1 Tax=Bordetella sp. 15P40C-2 TaxID=2572246 RepID=UPI00132780C6|nr:heavy-metal-associated domain-containing protein [Bordetella sp. 15P40C-2]MVW73126.1 copper chaperone [Bordetella sp. 15P40C-2]
MSIEFTVPDMTCGHCVATITKAVQGVAPQATVTTDLSSHRVTVEGANDADTVRRAIVDAGYEVAA